MRKEHEKSSLKESSSPVLKYSLGIDIGKDNLDVCLLRYHADQVEVICGTRKFANTSRGITDLYRWSESKRKFDVPLVFTLEATGVYYEKLALYLDSQGAHVSVLLPSRVKQYLRSRGQRTKNDLVDARGIARMGAELLLERWKRPSATCLALRQLTRYCETLQCTRTAALGHREALLNGGFKDDRILEMVDEEINFCETRIAELKKKVEELLSRDETCRSRVENLSSVKGLGLYTIAVILSETGFFEMFHSVGQLVSYAGYDVVENQSGRRAGKTKISKKGNAHIRRALHMPALNMRKYREPRLNALWERVFERSKRKMVAYVAVQRKLLLLIYTIWKKNTKYDPGHGYTLPVAREQPMTT